MRRQIVRSDFVKREAERMLMKHRVTAYPVPVEFIAEREGLRVYHDPNLSDDISGFLYRSHDLGDVVVVNLQHHPTRRRFTLAHELAHFVLHDGQNYVSEKVRFRNSLTSTGADVEEVEANQWAAELLMPPHLIDKAIAAAERYLTDDLLVKNLARDFGVSPLAMRIRLMALGYVDGNLFDEEWSPPDAAYPNF